MNIYRYIDAYNNIISYINSRYDLYDKASQNYCVTETEKCKKVLINCSTNLKCDYEISNNLSDLIDEVSDPIPNTSTESYFEGFDLFNEDSGNKTEVATSNQADIATNNGNNSNSSPASELESKPETEQDNQITMATIPDTIALCKSILPADFSVNAIELESFINKIQLSDTVVEDARKGTLASFVKTKLVGSALQA